MRPWDEHGCFDCWFWAEAVNEFGKGKGYGECRRYPPTLPLVSERTQFVEHHEQGMTPDVLRGIFSPFLSDAPERPASPPVTKTDFYELGLSGRPDAEKRRAEVTKSLGLPEDLPANALLDAVNILFSRDEFLSRLI